MGYPELVGDMGKSVDRNFKISAGIPESALKTWLENPLNGFIDEVKPVSQIAMQELREELGLDVAPEAIKVRESYTLQNPKEKRTYIVFPCLVELGTKPKISLDREHTDHTWIVRAQLESFHILDDLPYAIDSALG